MLTRILSSLKAALSPSALKDGLGALAGRLLSRQVLAGAGAVALLAFALAVCLNQVLGRLLVLPDGASAPDAIAVAEADGDVDGDTPPAPRRVSKPSKASFVQPVISRNIFDSSAINQAVDTSNDPEQKTDLRLVLLATVVAVPETSSSALIAEEGRNNRPMGYGVQDRLPGGDGVITQILQKRVVIQRNDGSTEYLDMGGEPDKRPARAAAKAEEPQGDEGIVKEGDKTVVERSVLDEALKNVDSLATQIRVVPHKGPDGQVDGYRLSAIRRGSLFDKLGIKNGDILHAVNGISLSSTDAAFGAYQTLQNESSFAFEVTRRNKKQTFEYEIR